MGNYGDVAGFIGLGIMGRPMAENLLKKGVKLFVNDVLEAPVARVAALGAVPAEAHDIASRCNIIFTMLPDDRISELVIAGDGGLASGIKAGALVVDMSSVTPGCSQRCSEALKGVGAAHLDAPVSGGEPKAEDGTLAFMVGGDKADFDRAQPYLELMGASVKHVGGSGHGALCKLANQVMVNLNIAAMSEAFVLLCKAGGEPWAAYEAIRHGLAGSAILDAKLPNIINRTFEPGGKMSINFKDIGNVMATARECGVPMPLTAQLFEIMRSMRVQDGPDEDHSSLVRYFERLANYYLG